MDIKTNNSCNEAVANLAHDLIESLRLAKENETPTLLLYSGGSSLSVFDQLSSSVLGAHLTVCALDERFDPTGENSNAVGFMKSAFYDALSNSDAHFVDTHVHEGEDLGALTLRMRTSIDAWISEHPEGQILAIIGVGEDGHTAGIMPYPNDEHAFVELFDGSDHVVGYDAGDRNELPLRITSTLPLMRRITHAWGLACGESKESVLNHLSEGSINEKPAKILLDLPGTIYSYA